MSILDNIKNAIPWYKGGNYSTHVEKKTGSFTIIETRTSKAAQDIQSWRDGFQLADDPRFPRRYKLYEVYDMSILDDDYKTASAKRKAAILNLNLLYSTGKKPNKKVMEWMENPIFREFKNDVLDTIFWGHSLWEFTQGKDFKYVLIPREHVEPNRGMILKRRSDTKGLEYRTNKFKKRLLELGDGFGLLLEVSSYAIYKRNSLGDWADYSEMSGNNFRTYKYDGSDPKVRGDAIAAIEKVGSGGVNVIPNDVNLEQLQMSSGSSNDLFVVFNRTMGNAILKLILGQTQTTNDDGAGSYAKAKVAKEVEKEINDNDRIMFLDFFNFKFKEYMKLWGLPTNGTFSFEEVDKLTTKEKLENDKALTDIVGFERLGKEYYEERYGVKLEDKEPGVKPIKKPDEKD